MRPDVRGTVARGQIQDLDFMTGIQTQKLAQQDPAAVEVLVRAYAQAEDAAKTDEPAAAKAEPANASVMDTTPWVDKNPLTLTDKVLSKGQEQFNIYCAVCHGRDGRGNGLVNERAQKILSQQWIPPASMHQDVLYSDKYPDGKLFSTITNGIRKMPGYAAQIKARDRWAIVAYVRALQASQNAQLDQIPEDQRGAIEQIKATVDKQLKEQAEAEKKKQAKADKK